MNVILIEIIPNLVWLARKKVIFILTSLHYVLQFTILLE